MNPEGGLSKVLLSALTIFLTLNFLSVFLLVPIPIFEIDLVHLIVTVGEVNGSLTLGTLDYCLEMSDQRICHPSPPKLAYTISNTQVLAQLTTGANNKIAWFSRANLAVLISGALVTLSCAYSTRCATLDPDDQQRWSDFKKADSIGLMCATTCAFVAMVSASIALFCESLLIRNQFLESGSRGFWFTLIILVVFTIFFIIMSARFVNLACKMPKEGGGRSAESLEEARGPNSVALHSDDSNWKSSSQILLTKLIGI